MTADNPADPDFAARRAAAREALSAIDPFLNGEQQPDPFRKDWFNAVYDQAGDDPAKVPWAKLQAHPLTAEWIAEQPGEALRGLAALDVGCGLGDNAEALAAAGCRVSAFDLAPRAIGWAQRRFPASSVDYRAGDLFNLPPGWHAAFDLVHECYTLQALPRELIPAAAAAMTETLRPAGKVLVIARARNAGDAISGPPWPLTRGDLAAFTAAGLTEVSVEDIAPRQDMVRHWRAVFEKAPG
jgi:SAM-dependent methyltransferase